MTCIGAMRRALVRLGFYPQLTDVEAKEAETENLVHDRSKVMGELVTRAATFKERSKALESNADTSRSDLEELLEHIHQINRVSEKAQSLLTRLLKNRANILSL